MKKLLFAYLLCFSISVFAQTKENPVVWKTSIEKINDSIYDVTFKGAILENWYVFSQYNPEDASLPMVISIPEGEMGFKLQGKATESATKKKYSDIWGVEEIIFTKKAIVTQRIVLTNKELTQVKLHLFGQVCETACIQFEDTYTFSLNGSTVQKQVIEVDSKSK